ncbi:MAG: SDR family NAD(P)-dependent oxidoreductase [Nitrospirota bacterium]|nr:SDR family NAD(P)-dependent oxidoreductase [Nitrospirota bacterium]
MAGTALVTGASSGIGRVFARELAREGYKVTCTARSRDRLEALVRELGDGHRVLVADLSDSSQLQSVVDDVERIALEKSFPGRYIVAGEVAGNERPEQ